MYFEELIEDVPLENDKVECKSLLNRDDMLGNLETNGYLEKSKIS